MDTRTLASLALGIAFVLPVDAHHAPGHRSAGGAEAIRISFSDRPLVTQDGAQVRFFSDLVKDKVVLINFVFTECVDTCPMQTAKVAAVQSLLGGLMGNPVHLLSISADPERDRPHVLREYSRRFDARPGWTFLTGEKTDIDAVTRRLAHAAPAREAHTSLFFLGNARTGRWLAVDPVATPLELAERLRDLAAESS